MTGETGNTIPRRRKFPLRQDVMDQEAVQTSVAVLERMDINEAEGSRGRLEHRIKFSPPRMRSFAAISPCIRVERSCGRAPMNSG
jgi:hypothetical protein